MIPTACVTCDPSLQAAILGTGSTPILLALLSPWPLLVVFVRALHRVD